MTTVGGGTNSAVLSWDANTEPDLAGYRVYYGTAPRAYQLSVDVGNTTTYVVTGLGAGAYYFAVTAYDNAGTEGFYSAESNKTF